MFGNWIMWVIGILAIASAGALPFILSYKPKNYVYLSPEAFSEKMKELEDSRFNEISEAESQMMIDNIMGKYDVIFSGYKIKGGK